MSLATAADRLADLDERLLAAGGNLTRQDQIVQARRRVSWARQWTTLARISTADEDGPLIEAQLHLGRALAALDRSEQ